MRQAEPADVIVLGVKAHSLTQLAPQVKPLIGANTTVVSTQNGVPWWYFEGGDHRASGPFDWNASIRAA